MPKVTGEGKAKPPKYKGLADVIKRSGAALSNKRKEPLWKGPVEDGITQSLLGRFLVCRERFRLMVVEGLKPADMWHARMGYGNLWHACEEEYHRSKGADDDWVRALLEHAKKDAAKYRTQQKEIQKWYNVCKTQFPLYLDYWKNHQDKRRVESLLQEEVFRVPYMLPSGRLVTLRGKWDGLLHLKEKGPTRGLYLFEHKTKSDLNKQKITRQLRFDLQTMMYLVSLETLISYCGEEGCPYLDDIDYDILPDGNTFCNVPDNVPLMGVLYNGIKRPLSGGKGTIKQKEAKTRKPKNKAEREKYGDTIHVPGETTEEYFARLAQYIKDDPEMYFQRWEVIVTAEDIKRFKNECLNPILEQLLDWWEFIKDDNPFKKDDNRIHWIHPFGVWNVMNEGGNSDLDEYLESKSEVGLVRVNNLYEEL